MKRRWTLPLLALGALALGALATGCYAPGKQAGATTPPTGGYHTPPPKEPPRRAQPRDWSAEIRSIRSISGLWNAIDRHHDALGKSLHPAYTTTRVRVPRVRPRRRPRRIGTRPPTHRVDRPPVTQRTRAPRCRRACAHVRAICYAARRICQIANRLGEDNAITTCKRANERCADAKRAARRRCRRC